MKVRYEYFPFYIRMEDQKIVVFGAGTIAARRVGKLLGTKAQITVIAPKLCDEMKRLLQPVAPPGSDPDFHKHPYIFVHPHQ